MSQPHIFQINLSNGGVPKLPVHDAQVTARGLDGDGHNDLKNHGGPNRALCLYSLERILDLQREGHPIFVGSTGENLALSGVDWAQMTPGTRLQLGDAAKIEITEYTTPCYKITRSFSGEQIDRIDQARHPGWARVYARVLSPGQIRTGDPVTLMNEHD